MPSSRTIALGIKRAAAMLALAAGMATAGDAAVRRQAAAPATVPVSTTVPASTTVTAPGPERAQEPAPVLRLHGIVEPVNSHPVTAPRLTGLGPGAAPGQLVVATLVPAGTFVKQGDLLVELDRNAQVKAARDREAEYRDVLAQIDKKQAEQALARADRQRDLALAENAVLRAGLDVRGNDMLPAITAEKNVQALEEARAHLAALRTTLDLQERAAVADMRILEIQRERSRAAWRHAVENADRMRIESPIDGLVVLKSVWKSGQMAEIQEGEEVRPGIPILEVVDPSRMRVRTLVNQADIARLSTGLSARITLDSFPGRHFDGRLERLSPVADTSALSTHVRTFVAIFSVDGADEHLLPDLAVAVDVTAATPVRAAARP